MSGRPRLAGSPRSADGADVAGGRALPPVTALVLGSMVLVVAGGIYLASHLPRPAPLGPALGLVAGAGLLFLVAALLLSKVRPFAWPTFFKVAGWALVAYVIITGLLEYVFVLDGTRGSVLVVLTLFLLAFALDIPLLFGFSVARYQPPSPEASGPQP